MYIESVRLTSKATSDQAASSLENDWPGQLGLNRHAISNDILFPKEIEYLWLYLMIHV